MNNKQLLDEVECGMKSYPDQVGLICETQKVNIQMSRHTIYFELTVPSWLSFTKSKPFSHQFHLQSFYCAFLQGPDYGSIKLKSLLLSHSPKQI